MSEITTHVLDTAAGRPAAGLAVTLEKETAGGTWEELSRRVTNSEGRIADFGLRERPGPGTYRLRFATGAYFARQGAARFYPEGTVAFTLASPEEHCHVPPLPPPQPTAGRTTGSFSQGWFSPAASRQSFFAASENSAAGSLLCLAAVCI